MNKKQLILIKLFLLISLSLLIMNFNNSIPKKYTTNQLIGKGKIALFGKQYKLQKEAYLSLAKMIKEARRQGVKIKVVSSYRDFNHQNRIWKRKFDKFISQGYSSKKAVEKVKEYSAIPGTSRHHWGTEVDLSNGKSKLTNSTNKKYSIWMNENAHKYGFYRVYTNNKLRAGYKYESWHYSFRKLSKPMLAQYNQLDLVKILKKEKIAGNKYFTPSFIKKYKENNVLGINDYLY
jgi:LAS superfamily LD-carboxypeptidase LdcB